MHQTIQIQNLGFSLPHKNCFDDFSSQVTYGQRIAIIGKNGTGKSTLLKCLAGIAAPSSGQVMMKSDVCMSYVPQLIEAYSHLSGGQRFNQMLSQALSPRPNLLLLDEPTNHIDMHNRKSLLRMLKNYHGTLIVVSHDTELLRNLIDCFWHIDNGSIHVFSGDYDDYYQQFHQQRLEIEKQLVSLNQQKKHMHQKLMQEQQRVAKSKSKGEKKIENRQWLKMVGNTKSMQAQQSQGKRTKGIENHKAKLVQQLNALSLPEIITPKFVIDSAELGHQMLIQISQGSIGYAQDKHILSDIAFSLGAKERIVLTGSNGSGKSTLIKAILGDAAIYKTGHWYTPKIKDIGYLDQHYSTLNTNQSVLENLASSVPSWSRLELRQHLNDFLFRKNEEVDVLVENLSGGEKARLSLALIAARPPKLLILDEITNNLDLETKQHVSQVLKLYPGAILLISHEQDLLNAIGIETTYNLEQGKISLSLEVYQYD